MVDEVPDRGRGVAGIKLVDLGELGVIVGTPRGGKLRQRRLHAGAPAARRWAGESVLFSQRFKSGRALGGIWLRCFDKSSISNELDDATGLLQRQKLFVIEVAAHVAERADSGVGGDDRRSRQCR